MTVIMASLVEKKLVFVDRVVFSLVNAAKNKVPVARKNGSPQADDVPDVPAEASGQLLARHAGFSLPKERGGFIVRQKIFRIKIKIGSGFNGKVGKEVFFIDIPPPKPVSVGNNADAVHATDFILVGNGQGKDQGNGVSRNQTAGRRGFHAGIPCADDGSQQAKSQNCQKPELATAMPPMVSRVLRRCLKAFRNSNLRSIG